MWCLWAEGTWGGSSQTGFAIVGEKVAAILVWRCILTCLEIELFFGAWQGLLVRTVIFFQPTFFGN